eukprot:m.68273 g.68273  ORF g.68273 m.68273 type:complete len:182 (+) comp15981_c0_seq1:74-619(+)
MTSSLSFVLAAMCIGVSLAHPSSLTCMTDDTNRIKPGAVIMGQTVTTDITTLQFKSDSKTFTPGQPVQLSVTQLPTGAFFAIRASGQIGEFGNFSSDVVQTVNCPSQCITPNDPSHPPTPPAESSMSWTPPSDTTASSVILGIAWGLGTVSPSGTYQGYVHTLNITLTKAASVRGRVIAEQ